MLGGEPAPLPEGQLFNLASVLIDVYGPGYAGHPRLASIMEINRISDKDFLTGKDEADAFENGDYVSLHQSTLRKVEVIHNLGKHECLGSLKTRSKLSDQYGNTVAGLVDLAMDHWAMKVIGILGIIGSILGTIFFIM